MEGIEFFILLEHPLYSDNWETELQSIEQKDRVELTLESINKSNTKWICCEFSLI